MATDRKTSYRREMDREQTGERTGEGKDFGLSGLEKAAILMISLGSEASSFIYKNLEEEEIENITKQIVCLKNVTSEIIDYVIDDYHSMILAQQYIKSGGVAFAQKILEEAIGTEKALEMIRKVQRLMKVRGFNVLKDVEPDQLLTFIQKEHPQTIAFVLTQLNPTQASEILANLDPDLQADVVRRFAGMDRVTPETVSAVERVLETRIDMISGTTASVGGLRSVAEVLNMMGFSVSQKILGDITEQDYELATNIKNLMFTFEDIIQLDNNSIQKVLKEVENKDLTKALKGVADEVKDKILGNISERARSLINEEMEYMGPIKLSDVEVAQQSVVDVINKLKEDGQIVVVGGSNAEQMIE